MNTTIDALREELRARHGATYLDVDVRVDAEARHVVATGDVLVHRLIGVVRERLARPGFTVDVSGLRVWAGGAWREVAERMPLFAHRSDGALLSTVLRAEDGPVQELVDADGASLVRGRDGTVGWAGEALGRVTEAVPLAAPSDVGAEAFVAVARGLLGVPYELGGTDEVAIDCSGLVQRAVRRSHDIVVPRHSTDQRAIGAEDGMGEGVGRLVFVWTAAEAPCHVGIATTTGVVHASRSRRAVVEDPLEAFCGGATRIEHVPFATLVAFAQANTGTVSLIAAGVELGAAAE